MVKIYCAPCAKSSGSATVYALLEYAFLIEHGGSIPKIKKTPNGKPYFPKRLDIHFSLSHTKSHVLCALSGDPVGVDIESRRRISKRAESFFISPCENSLFHPLDLWVLKESYLKLKGWTLPSVRTMRFSREGDRIFAPDASVLSKLYHIAGCHAAASTTGNTLPDSIELVPSSVLPIIGSSDFP